MPASGIEAIRTINKIIGGELVHGVHDLYVERFLVGMQVRGGDRRRPPDYVKPLIEKAKENVVYEPNGDENPILH